MPRSQIERILNSTAPKLTPRTEEKEQGEGWSGSEEVTAEEQAAAREDPQVDAREEEEAAAIIARAETEREREGKTRPKSARRAGKFQARAT